MAEFDFDELDKAVSTLMQQQAGAGTHGSEGIQEAASGAAASAAEETVSVVDGEKRTTELTLPDRPEVAEPSLVSEDRSTAVPERSAIANPRPETSQLPAARPTRPSNDTATEDRSMPIKRRGKFMDVVASPSTKLKTTKSPKRSGNTLQPTGSLVTSPTGPVTTRSVDGISQPLSATRPSQTVFSTPDAVEPVLTTDTPAIPEDVASDKPQVEPSSAEGSLDDSSNVDGPNVMDSPFLPDAKVEKRPLGAPVEVKPDRSTDSQINGDDVKLEATDQAQDSTPGVNQQSLTTSDNLEQLVSNAGDSTSDDLPAELGQDVLSVELSEAVSTDKSSSVEAVPEPRIEQPKSLSDEAATVARPAANANLVGALPPRQAVKKPATAVDDEPKKSIFDTDETQTGRASTKHSTKWYTTMIIGSMVLLGVVGGAIFYLMNNGY